MRKTKHFFLALMAVTALSTAWASGLSGSKPDGTPAKTSYAVQWTGVTDLNYDGNTHALTATYNDGTDHQLSIRYSKIDINGNPGTPTATAPKDAATWLVEAVAPSGITLTGATTYLDIHPAVVTVSGVEVQTAMFYHDNNHDGIGDADGIVTNMGVLNGVIGTDDVGHVTSAIFTNAMGNPNGEVGTGKYITLYYALTGSQRDNYALSLTQEPYGPNTPAGVILAEIRSNNTFGQQGFAVSNQGYCGGDNSIDFALASGTTDQYRIDFADARFADINWRYYSASTTIGATGTIAITVPANVPEGNYAMNVYFRDRNYPNLESQPFTVNFSVRLSSEYTKPLFDNVIALVNTCNCFDSIQWYHNGALIPGATGYFYREEGGLTGEYYVTAKKDGVPVATCPQSDLTNLISDATHQAVVTAYPNPTVENVTIAIDGSENDVHTFTVLSTLGVEMLRGAFVGDNVTLDMSNFQHGSYMVNVDGNVVRVIKK